MSIALFAKQPLNWRKVGPAYWPRYKALLSQPATRTTDSLSTPSGTWPTGNSYRAAITLPDNRVFCAPYNTTAARVYDPATGTTTVLSYTYPGNYNNWMACLLFDGRVFMAPALNYTTAYIWTPATDTVTSVGGFYSACGTPIVMPDGRVIMPSSGASTNWQIWNPADNSVTNIAAAAYCSGAALLPDGRIASSQIGALKILDVSTGTLTTFSHGSIPANSRSLKVLSDGRLMVGGISGPGVIYDPATNTAVAITAPNNGFEARRLLPDGTVLMIPTTVSTNAIIYDPRTDTYVTSFANPAAQAFYASAMLRDGRVFMPACNITSSRLWDGGFGVTLSDAWLLSPYTNVSP